MEIPNFDAMNQEELRAFWSKWHVTTNRKAVEFLGARVDARTTMETLANYAINKSTAMGLRIEGRISEAMRYEEHCELAYDRLPADVRW